jgi:WD40 repeat protein
MRQKSQNGMSRHTTSRYLYYWRDFPRQFRGQPEKKVVLDQPEPFMRISRETLAGTVLISALVAVGMWYANDPDVQHWPPSPFGAGATGQLMPQFTVHSIDWSADGQRLLAVYRGEDDLTTRMTLHEVSSATGSISIDGMGDSVSASALAPDGRHVLVGSDQGRLWWIDPDSQEFPIRLNEFPESTRISAATISADGLLVAAATARGSIRLYDPTRRASVELTTRGKSSVADLRFSGDGNQLVSAHNNGQVSVWNVVTRKLLQEFPGHEQERPAIAASFLSDGNRVISAGLDDTVRIWEISSGRELWRGEFGLYGVRALAVSPDARTAAWGGFNHKIIVWDLECGRKKFEITTSASIILNLKFSPDGTSLATAGREGTIRFYDVQTGAEMQRLEVATARQL